MNDADIEVRRGVCDVVCGVRRGRLARLMRDGAAGRVRWLAASSLVVAITALGDAGCTLLTDTDDLADGNADEGSSGIGRSDGGDAADADAGAAGDAGGDAPFSPCATQESDPSLVAYFPFEESTGTGGSPVASVSSVTDCSASHLVGRLGEGAVLLVDGHRGKALDFDGKGKCFDLGTASNLAFANNAEFSVSAWVKIRGYSSGEDPRWFVGRADAPNDQKVGWGIGTDNPDGVEFKIQDPSQFAEVQVSVPVDAFVHVGAVFVPGKVSIRVNGVTSSKPIAHPLQAEGFAHAWLGCRSSGEPSFDGVLDELRIYGRALSDAELDALAGQ